MADQAEKIRQLDVKADAEKAAALAAAAAAEKARIGAENAWSRLYSVQDYLDRNGNSILNNVINRAADEADTAAIQLKNAVSESNYGNISELIASATAATNVAITQTGFANKYAQEAEARARARAGEATAEAKAADGAGGEAADALPKNTAGEEVEAGTGEAGAAGAGAGDVDEDKDVEESEAIAREVNKATAAEAKAKQEAEAAEKAAQEKTAAPADAFRYDEQLKKAALESQLESSSEVTATGQVKVSLNKSKDADAKFVGTGQIGDGQRYVVLTEEQYTTNCIKQSGGRKTKKRATKRSARKSSKRRKSGRKVRR